MNRSRPRSKINRSAFDDACRFLTRRRLTELEIRNRLSKYHNKTDIEECIEKLKEYRFIDDETLIVDYIKDRLNLSPRSVYLIKFELQKRGIEGDVFDPIFKAEFSDYSEIEIARRALDSRLKRLMNQPPQSRRKRALRFLYSRGFSYDVALEICGEMSEDSNS